MAGSKASSALRALPPAAKALLAKGLVGTSLEKFGKSSVLSKGHSISRRVGDQRVAQLAS